MELTHTQSLARMRQLAGEMARLGAELASAAQEFRDVDEHRQELERVAAAERARMRADAG